MTAPRISFKLSGQTVALDPRINAVRPDLTDCALAGTVFGSHYAVPMAMECAVVATALHQKPDAGSEVLSQLLLGERFMVLDNAGGWAWGYCAHDHHVGYVPSAVLAPATAPVTGSVVTRRETPLYPNTDIDEPTGTLPMGARVHRANGSFYTSGVGFVKSDAVDEIFADPVAVAERLIDVPYLWGGRSGAGVDCSGLVQLSLALTGTVSPRDSDMQQDALGVALAGDATLERGDLVFFPGHVGMMVDSTDMIHATQHYGKVVVEPLADVVARGADGENRPVVARKRLG